MIKKLFCKYKAKCVYDCVYDCGLESYAFVKLCRNILSLKAVKKNFSCFLIFFFSKNSHIFNANNQAKKKEILNSMYTHNNSFSRHFTDLQTHVDMCDEKMNRAHTPHLKEKKKPHFQKNLFVNVSSLRNCSLNTHFVYVYNKKKNLFFFHSSCYFSSIILYYSS